MGPFLASIALSFGLLAHLLQKGYAFAFGPAEVDFTVLGSGPEEMQRTSPGRTRRGDFMQGRQNKRLISNRIKIEITRNLNLN